MDNDRGTHQDAADQSSVGTARVDVSAGRQALRHLRAAAEAAGATAVRDVQAAGRLVEGNRCLGRIHADQQGAWVLTRSLPEASEPVTDELLLLLVQRLALEWDLDVAELAQALDCKAQVLALWLSAPRHFRLPPAVAATMNRLIAIDRLRVAAGVSAEHVGDWLNRPRAELEHRSVFECLLSGEQDCFWAVMTVVKAEAVSRRARVTGLRLSRRGPWFAARSNHHHVARSSKRPQ